METVKETLKEVSDTVQGAGKKAEAEKDKEVAKGNTDAGLGARVDALTDYAKDKKDQKSHEYKADAHEAKADAS